MHLATVLTKGQWDLLNAAYDNVTFTGHYWTGARDAHELRQLSWDINSTAITGTAVASFGNDVGSLPLTCAALASNSGILSLHIEECSYAHRVLCET
ncbi:unnamed protein product [Orchesella dallaii]|uniref:C-type lectin domain-containing protein n=1 Tax=Orchesella dallaii TaxID=48710 RepID=A0ABP1S174_9HEXA